MMGDPRGLIFVSNLGARPKKEITFVCIAMNSFKNKSNPLDLSLKTHI